MEKHVLLEFRRIASYVYKKNKRWQQSITVSKADKMYKDAIDPSTKGILLKQWLTKGGAKDDDTFEFIAGTQTLKVIFKPKST